MPPRRAAARFAASVLVGLASPAALLPGCARPEDPPWARAALAQAGEPTIAGEPVSVPRLSSPPVLDGKLDDAAWAGAATLGPFVDPTTGAEAPTSPVAAFARIGWDDSRLYLGLVVRDGDPGSPYGRDDVDPRIWSRSSAIELMLQPGDPGDNRDYFELQVDVAGAVFDTRWEDSNKPIAAQGDERRFGHEEWQSGVERAVHVSQGSFYSVELALPWSSLAPSRAVLPPAPGDLWRLNLYSFRDGQRRALAWSPIRRRGNFHFAAQFGRVKFVR